MLDNNVVLFDKQSYHEMVKDSKEDIAQYNVAQSKKSVHELKKQEIEKQEDGGYSKLAGQSQTF